MSVSCITSNPKFLLLVRRLKLPTPYVRGLLDTMWDTCHERASEVIGTPEEVEACAQWPGEDGTFFSALRDCRWIDEVSPGVWGAHNYWKHCPSYVTQRLKMRRWRAEKRQMSLAGLEDVTGLSPDGPEAVTGPSRDCDVTIATYPEPEPEPEPEPRKTDKIKNPPIGPPRGAKPTPVSNSPPDLSEVTAFVETLGAGGKASEYAQRFLDYYASVGWRQKGGLPITDWRAACRRSVRMYSESRSDRAPPAGLDECRMEQVKKLTFVKG